jgi:transposase-like protein
MAKHSKAAEVWRERVVAQQASGQAVRAWCRQHGCHEHGFYWWRAKLGLSPTPIAARRQRRRSRPVAFTEVMIERSAAEPIVLRLPGGRELLLPPSMPVTRLAELLRAIEAAS